jgi:hypothetical protein
MINQELDLVNKRYRSCQSAITLLARSWATLSSYVKSIPEIDGATREQLLVIKVELDKMKKVFDAVVKLMEQG